METETKQGVTIGPKQIENAEPLAAAIMQKTKDSIGFVPNMYELMANNPALLESYTSSYRSFRENAGFTAVEQEVVFLSVAYENECEYCMAAHSFVADKMSGVPTEVTNSIREGKEISDKKLNALSKLARSITRNRGLIEQEEIETFLSAGYSKEHILGIITGVGVKTFSNYLNHIAHTSLDEAFMERKWSK